MPERVVSRFEYGHSMSRLSCEVRHSEPNWSFMVLEEGKLVATFASICPSDIVPVQHLDLEGTVLMERDVAISSGSIVSIAPDGIAMVEQLYQSGDEPGALV